MYNRKSTSDVISIWRDYLNGSNSENKRRINEAPEDYYSPGAEDVDFFDEEYAPDSLDPDNTTSARDRSECLESIISDLASCNPEWDQDRVDALIAILEDENKVSDEELCMIAYSDPVDDDYNPGGYETDA
tara:strand:- start:20 stop:412 length:393 start_codon:yes stop_codon:yes gene_type:complete